MVASVAALVSCSPSSKSVSTIEEKVSSHYESPALVSPQDLNSLLREMPLYHNLKSKGLSLDVFYDSSLQEQRILFNVTQSDSSAFEVRINPPTRINDLFDHEFEVYRALVRTSQFSKLVDHYNGVDPESERWKIMLFLARLPEYNGFPGLEFDESFNLLLYQKSKYGDVDRRALDNFFRSYVRVKLLDVYDAVPRIQRHVAASHNFIEHISGYDYESFINKEYGLKSE